MRIFECFRMRNNSTVRTDGSYELKPSACPYGSFSSYGRWISVCGNPKFPLCPIETEGTINGCYPPFAKKAYDIGEDCQPCPSETVYLNGVCPACGRLNDPVCDVYTADVKNGCFDPYVNNALSKLVDCEHLLDTGYIWENDMARKNCE